jgi:hypothetical protein
MSDAVLIRKLWEDLGYAATLSLHENGFSVSFAIYNVVGTAADDGTVFIGNHDVTFNSPEWPIEQAVFDGFIKFDGCLQWYPTEEGIPVHFCGRSDIDDFAKLFDGIYSEAMTMMGDKADG